MKLALILPPYLIQKMEHLTRVEVLRADFLHRPEVADFYRRPKSKYRILNSEPHFDPRRLFSLAEEFDVDEIIIPNQPGSHTQTWRKLQEFLDYGLLPHYTYQAVLESNTINPSMKVLEDLRDTEITVIGLPKSMVMRESKQARLEACQVEGFIYDALGTAGKRELNRLVFTNKIRYLHSSRPIYMGKKGQDIRKAQWPPKRYRDYPEPLKYNKQMDINVQKLEELITFLW